MQDVDDPVRAALIALARFDPAIDGEIRASLARLTTGQWSVVFQLASAHRVLANLSRIVAADDTAPGLSRAFARRQLLFAKRQAGIRRYESEKALALLEGEGVAAVALKGHVLGTECYPEYYLREAGDLDLLVDESDLEVVAEALTSAGFAQRQLSPSTWESAPLSAARLRGYRSELQHLGEFLLERPDGAHLVIDVHHRLATAFDHIQPDHRALLTRRQTAGAYQRFHPADFVAHLGYHAWWDTQSVVNVRSGLDLRLFQFGDVLRAFQTWDLHCDGVLAAGRDASIEAPTNWVLWVTGELFGPLPGYGSVDIDAAESLDRQLADRWLQRSTAEPLGTWDETTPTRMFDPRRGDRASAMVLGWLDSHTKRGDVLRWDRRDEM